MTPEERVKAVEAFGFTERQARFLVTVMLSFVSRRDASPPPEFEID